MPERRRLDPSFATTADIMEAAGVTRRTVTAWIDAGLLPKPVKISLGSAGGVFNRFPMLALEHVRFILAKRAEGLSLQQIAELLAAQGGPVARSAVRSRDVAPKSARPARRRR
jgi:DNA-binding transcriptional MerR regulator